MKDQETSTLRNVALVGHGHSGKTSLVEALLFANGQLARLGSVAAGSTVTDYGDDEHSRKLSIRVGLAHLLTPGAKVNLVDTPGFANFLYDAKVGLSVADTALLVLDAVHGIEVQSERTWAHAREVGVPASLIVLNKMDREHASFEESLKACADRFGRGAVAVQVPIGSGDSFRGVVDLITRRAYLSKADGSAATEVTDAPADLAGAITRRRDQLVEMVAETDETLMERYLERGELSDEELREGLRKATWSGQIMPVACVSATKVVGMKALGELLVEVCPPPTVRPERLSKDGAAKRACSDSEPPSIQVFKTLSDPYAGRLSLFRVWSGVVKGDAPVFNVTRDHEERTGGVLVLQGKEQIKVPQLHAGDIGCFAKLKDTFTGDTLTDKQHPIEYAPLGVPEPMMSFALEPKNLGDEEKVASALHKIGEEDLVLRWRLDPQTKELVVSGAGDGHVEAVVERLRDRFKVEVVLHPPRVPYRETITRPAAGEYRHKKQSGGAGQFAEVHMEVKPLTRGGGFEYDTSRVFGGAITNNFFPSIQKGIQAVLERGPLGGYPVVDVRCEVYDGKMHAVDSKDIAFQTAGRQLMRQLVREAGAILLEPIMSVRVDVPIESMGDVMGDLSSRRGRVQGMEAEGNREIIRAQVPLAEMLTYQAQLKSMTGGRGDFNMELDHYDPVPHQVQEKVLAQAKRHASDED
jgi:elongation factor G